MAAQAAVTRPYIGIVGFTRPVRPVQATPFTQGLIAPTCIPALTGRTHSK